MAIQKSKTLPSGASGNYWRILTLSADRPTLTINCSIALYLDAAHAASGAPHLGLIKHFTFTITNSELMTSNLIALMYTKIAAKAAEMVTVSFVHGQSVTPQQFDSDIADGTAV